MEQREVANITRQANAIGRARGVFCVYKQEVKAAGFVWIFYREGRDRAQRLGACRSPAQVVKRMERYAGTKG